MAFKFEKLAVWQEAMDLGDGIDLLTATFPAKELYNLTAQIRRAADSVALNIAEGSTASSAAEQSRFLNIGIRSCCETACCLHKARRRHYIDEDLFQQVYAQLDRLTARIQALRNKIQQR